MTEPSGHDQGALNAWDRALLDRHLGFYRSLHLRERRPTTEAQRHFIQVCLGSARPRTQHEIAYVRYLQDKRSTVAETKIPPKPSALPNLTLALNDEAGMAGADIVPTPEMEAAVETIEEALIGERLGRAARASLERMRGAYRTGMARAGSASSDAYIWLNALLADRDFTGVIERWMGENWNTLSNEYSRAIDGAFAQGLNAGPEYISPLWHRLLEGHGLLEAFDRARGALPDDTLLQEIQGTASALFSDFTSSVGLPVIGLNQGQADVLRGIGERLGLSESWIVDALSLNLTELVVTTVPVLALALAWREDDRKRFEELMGGLAVGVQLKDVAGNVARGGLVSAVFLSASASVSGPVWVGLLVGLIAVLALRKAGRELSTVDWKPLLARYSPVGRPA